MKILKIGGIALALTVALTGCDTVVSVPSDKYGVIVDGSGRTDYEDVYSNENMVLSGFCWDYCEKAHTFERSKFKVVYDGKYIMPENDDLELELGIELVVSFDDSKANISKTLQNVAESYPVNNSGSIRQSFVDSVVEVDLSEAKVKDTLRPILAVNSIETVMRDVTSENNLKVQIHKVLSSKLAESPLTLHDLNFVSIGWPESITNKKKEIAEMDSEREIERKRLQNNRAKEAERQAFRIEQALNDVEIDSLYQKVMSPEMISWLWVDTAKLFAENGVPFAVDPVMLAVGTKEDSKKKDVDVVNLRNEFSVRLSELEDEKNKELGKE